MAALGFRGFAPIVDTLVKERLTGAIILVALIVVLVPELLSGPIRPAARAHGPTPSAEEPPLRSYTIDLDDAHGGSGTLRPQPSSAPLPAAPAAAESTAAQPPVATPQADTSVAAPTQPAPPTQAVSPAPVAQPPASARATVTAPPAAPQAVSAASTTGYVVQLGSFANRSNAERLAQRVHSLGFPVAVSRSTTGRHLYRVQVGPAHDRAAAEQILSKLRAQGHAGSVVPK